MESLHHYDDHNLEGKVADLFAEGLSLDEAEKKAKENLPSIVRLSW